MKQLRWQRTADGVYVAGDFKIEQHVVDDRADGGYLTTHWIPSEQDGAFWNPIGMCQRLAEAKQLCQRAADVGR